MSRKKQEKKQQAEEKEKAAIQVMPRAWSFSLRGRSGPIDSLGSSSFADFTQLPDQPPEPPRELTSKGEPKRKLIIDKHDLE